MTDRKKLLCAVFAVALAGVVAACSSGTRASTSSAGTAAPIKVGLICSCSGAIGSSLLAEEDVYKAWVNTVDGSGGINGHQIQLTAMDDTTNPGTSSTDANTLISDKVDAIVDMSSVDSTWASAVQTAGIPVVGAVISGSPFITNPDFYAEGETADSQGLAYILTLKNAGASSFGDVYCVEAVACAQYLQVLKADGAKQGVGLSYSSAISGAAPNYTAQCLAAKQHGVNYMIIEDNYPVLEKVASDCAVQGFKPTYAIGGSSYSALWLTTPGLKDNTLSYWADMPSWSNIPAVATMNAAVDKYYPGLRNNGTLWNGASDWAWPSGLLLEDALKAGGLTPSATPSAAEIVTGLDSLHGDTLGGFAPPLTYTAGKANPVECWFTGQVQNGVPSMLNNGQATCPSS